MKPDEPCNILLLRGLTRESRHWGDFPQILQQHIPLAQIHAIDLPGNGQFNQLNSPLSIADYARFVSQQLENMENEKPVVIVGLSLGGMAAIEFASLFPGACAGLVLINISSRDQCAFYQRFRLKHYHRILLAVLKMSAMARESLVLELTSKLFSDDAGLLQKWVEIAQNRPVSLANLLRQLIAASRFHLPEAKPDTPVLLLNSLQDDLVAPGCSQKIAQFWGVNLRSHPTAGHDLPLDDGEWVAQCIDEWFFSL